MTEQPSGVTVSMEAIYQLVLETRDLARDTNNKQKEHSNWIKEHAENHEEKGGYDERLSDAEGETKALKPQMKGLWGLLSAIVLYIIGAFFAK